MLKRWNYTILKFLSFWRYLLWILIITTYWLPITCQPQAKFLYTVFLIFIKICKVGIKYSSQSTKLLKKKTFFGKRQKKKTKQNHETNEGKKKRTKPTSRVVGVGLASRQAAKQPFQGPELHSIRALRVDHDPTSADFLKADWICRH